MAKWNEKTQNWDFGPDEIESQVAAALATESGEGGVGGLHILYQRTKNRYQVNLSNGVDIAFPPRLIEGLAGRSARELGDVHILSDGDTIEWEQLDLHLSLSALMAGCFGNTAWNEKVAAMLRKEAASRAGQGKSERKSASSKANGALGGRPRKPATVRPDAPTAKKRTKTVGSN
jgi:hypothetical protein